MYFNFNKYIMVWFNHNKNNKFNIWNGTVAKSINEIRERCSLNNHVNNFLACPFGMTSAIVWHGTECNGRRLPTRLEKYLSRCPAGWCSVVGEVLKRTVFYLVVRVPRTCSVSTHIRGRVVEWSVVIRCHKTMMYYRWWS